MDGSGVFDEVFLQNRDAVLPSTEPTRSTHMDPLALTLTAAGIVVGVQVGLFAWLKHDISDVARGLSNRFDRVERDVAFVRGQLSLALPAALAHQSGTPAAAED